MPSDSTGSDKKNISRRRFLATSAVVAPAMMALSANPQTSSKATEENGKVAVVTGSSRGIGAAIAKRLAQDGYKVTVNCVKNTELAAGVVRDIERAGGQAIWRQADVSDARAVASLFEANEKEFGGVDVVVSNAGIMRLAPFAKMTDEDFNRMIDVNIKGSFHVLREAARRVSDGGRILTLSSSITQLRSPTYGPYAASKAAQDMYAGVLAKELGTRRVSVNAIAPGLVNTTLFTDGKTKEEIQGFVQRTPFGRLGEPEDIANVVSTLVRGDGGWVTGQVVFVNGGVV
ncbi:MAG TPA: SDR family oxidoreductase [Steroidobacter sp.]|uniref:SDR family oxidoreductase n=1 Tax=Steroidobacter sp. TaxID=1978227 RepID=UPI002ED82E2C